MLAAAGAVAGLAAIALLWSWSAPVRGHMANIRNEGEVAAIVPREDIRVWPSSPDGFADWERELAAVRAEVEPIYAANRRDLDAVLAAPSPTLSHGLRRLRLWSDLKVAWATALARHGLGIERYAFYAASRPAPVDLLLLDAPAAGTVTAQPAR